MSGLEVAASCFAFVQVVPEVVKCISKAYQLWQQIKNVPEDILEHLEELKAVESFFCGIETQIKGGDLPKALWQDSTMMQSLAYSKRAHKTLVGLVVDLQQQVDGGSGVKRKFAVMRVSLKRTVLEKLNKRLEKCLTHLQTSMQLFQIAFMKSIPEIVSRRVTADILCHIQQPSPPKLPDRNADYEARSKTKHLTQSRAVLKQRSCTLPCSTSNFGRIASVYSRSTGAWQACVQLPSWLSNTVWELQSSPVPAGWAYNYRTYNIVPGDSDIIQKVKSGNTIGVMELFASRKASPFDKDEIGNSLLYYAAVTQRYDICELLLNMGLQSLLDETVGPGRESPLSVVALASTRESNPQVQRIAQLFTSFFDEPDAIPVERLFDMKREFDYSDNILFKFRDLFMPQYYDLSLRDRLEAVRLAAFTIGSVSTFRKLLTIDETVKSFDVNHSTREKVSLVHSSALAMATRFADDLIPHSRPHCYVAWYEPGWSKFVTDVASVAKSQDLHSIELVSPWDTIHVPAWRGTPLTSVVGGALCYTSSDITLVHWDRIFQGCLRRWLRDLGLAGVDLLEYGQREASILRDDSNGVKGAFDGDAIETSRSVLRKSLCKASIRTKAASRRSEEDMVHVNNWIPIRIIGIKAGQSADDWHLLWAPEFEHMARQFWELIERESIRMPGAWVGS